MYTYVCVCVCSHIIYMVARMFAMLKRPLIAADKWVVISFLLALATLHAGQTHPTPLLQGQLRCAMALKLNWFYRAQKPKPDPEKTRTRRWGWGWRWHGSLFYHFILKLLINGVFSSSTSYLCTYRTYTHTCTYKFVCSYAILETCALTPVFVACFMGLVGDRANGLGDKSVAWGLVWMLAPTYHTIPSKYVCVTEEIKAN